MSASRHAPVKHTCPDIDAVIESLQAIGKEMDKAESFEDCDLKGWSGVIDDIAYGSRCSLEELRSSNSALRDWGHELVGEMDDYENERDAALNEVEELKKTIDLLQDQLYDLEKELQKVSYDSI